MKLLSHPISLSSSGIRCDWDRGRRCRRRAGFRWCCRWRRSLDRRCRVVRRRRWYVVMVDDLQGKPCPVLGDGAGIVNLVLRELAMVQVDAEAAGWLPRSVQVPRPFHLEAIFPAVGHGHTVGVQDVEDLVA
jgi:hypothetical protein